LRKMFRRVGITAPGRSTAKLSIIGILACFIVGLALLCGSVTAQENSAEDWIKKGDDLINETNNLEEGLTAYEKAIQIDPENIDAWDRKALILFALEQQAYRRVLNLSEMRLAKNPLDSRAWQAQSAALASLGMQDEANVSGKKALEIYDQEIKDDPSNATAWFYKAELTAKIEGSQAALSAYDKVIELNGSLKVDALITKGNTLLNLGRYDEALDAIEKAIESEPENSLAWHEKAIYHYVREEYAEALAAYEKMTELKPKSALAQKGKADALRAMGRQAEADAAYSRAMELGTQSLVFVGSQDGSAESWYKKGLDLERNGSFDEAISAYDMSIQIDPTGAVGAWISKGYLLMRLGRHNESIGTFNKAIERMPADDSQNLSRIWEFKAIVMEMLDRPEEACIAFDKVTELNPNSTLAWTNKGELLNKLGRHQEALDAYEAALQNSSLSAMESARASRGKGNSLELMGRHEEAMKAYKDSLNKTNLEFQMNPESYLAWRDKGATLYRMGMYEEAIVAYDEALKNSDYPGQVWSMKADALKALGRIAESEKAREKAESLGYVAISPNLFFGVSFFSRNFPLQ